MKLAIRCRGATLALAVAARFLDAQQAPSDQNTESARSDTTSRAAPFSFADFTWANGNGRSHSSPLDTKYFTPEFRFDGNYIWSANRPSDHTLDGASEAGRVGEVQVQQLGVGGDFHYNQVRGRLMTQFGMYSVLTPRNDASPARGQWDLLGAYRYISEAYGGYHWNTWNGINLDVGIFLSYIGLFSYYNADNWAYQPSYVSANTPWYFNGIRLQTFPSQKLKIEYWVINGWQSYGMFNGRPGFGVAFLWRPTGSIQVVSNNYEGYDTFGAPNRVRVHTDNSFLLKYYDQPGQLFGKAALSATVDLGCESGGGVQCTGNSIVNPNQSFVGWMFYNRAWFAHDHYGVTVGGGSINNPGRYLVLLPPINGATAISGTPYFTTNPGTAFRAWDASLTFDWMPSDFVTFRSEINHRESNVPYFVGRGGITPPGGNQGALGSAVAGWMPDLVKYETRLNLALLVKL